MLNPFQWKDRPALIEHLFPVQKLSAESYKEQMANQGKTLTALGSYWKGRKPLILNKACLLGCLLPATENPLKDLEIFEMLMGMDKESLQLRLEDKNDKASRFFLAEEKEVARQVPYNEWVRAASRPEECGDSLFAHIWERVNAHLGTSVSSFPELVEQMGIARFGHRPRVADVFCGSGQIPFEAARLGCDVYASDLNPIACLLTWGAFNIVGASKEKRKEIDQAQKKLAEQVQKKIDTLGVETDGNGWRAKAYLYCVEVVCPQSGWKVPLMPSFIVSEDHKALVELHPNPKNKSYDIQIALNVSPDRMLTAKQGTVQAGDVVHSTDGTTVYSVSLGSIRGDYKDGKENKNRLRLWEKSDFIPRPDDIFQERLYCVQWMRKKKNSNRDEYEFRSVTADDLVREQKVIDTVRSHLADWQEQGFVPDMVIEKGEETERLYRERGWTHWHHLFNPRQLLVLGLIRRFSTAATVPAFCQAVQYNSRLSMWHSGAGGRAGVQNVFSNQALNTLFNYGSRGFGGLTSILQTNYKSFPFDAKSRIESTPAHQIVSENDLYITDPPYGDAVKYEEITEFFIAWLRKNPPAEFAHWTWDSRRSLAIKGEDEGFRQGMVAAYRKMAEKMPDNGIQVLMFTHQSGSIWGDMTNIIWASGLQVTAAWYVVTETDSALRQGANVTGTIILVLRKRHQDLETFRDDLAWEIEEAVKKQVESLLSLDQAVRSQNVSAKHVGWVEERNPTLPSASGVNGNSLLGIATAPPNLQNVQTNSQGSEGLYTDADLQMAGYAAALKVLTAYSTIDGKNMITEAEAPRQAGKKTFVDELIDFAVLTAVQFLVPVGFEKGEWQKLSAVERFYLKMAEMEHQGSKTLDNYGNFAKAFKVRHFDPLMSDDSKANSARLKLSGEFKGSLMSGDSELAPTPLRVLLYALYELNKDTDAEEVLLHLMENCPNYMQNKPLLIKMADYLAEKRATLKPTKTFHPDTEASAARILAESLRNQKL
ncbi:DUF1156 domain-containing protein [Deltaproteobacteria bacterium TL4]